MWMNQNTTRLLWVKNNFKLASFFLIFLLEKVLVYLPEYDYFKINDKLGLLSGDLILGDNGVMWYVDLTTDALSSMTHILPQDAWNRVTKMKVPFSYWDKALEEYNKQKPFWKETDVEAAPGFADVNTYSVVGVLPSNMIEMSLTRLFPSSSLFEPLAGVDGDPDDDNGGYNIVLYPVKPQDLDFMTQNSRSNVALTLGYIIARTYAQNYDNCLAFLRPIDRKYIQKTANDMYFYFPLISTTDMATAIQSHLSNEKIYLNEILLRNYLQVYLYEPFWEGRFRSLGADKDWTMFLVEIRKFLDAIKDDHRIYAKSNPLYFGLWIGLAKQQYFFREAIKNGGFENSYSNVKLDEQNFRRAIENLITVIHNQMENEPELPTEHEIEEKRLELKEKVEDYDEKISNLVSLARPNMRWQTALKSLVRKV